MEPVKCFIPETLEEALRIRKETGATVLAGGSDLMVANSMGAGEPPAEALLREAHEEASLLAADAQNARYLGSFLISRAVSGGGMLEASYTHDLELPAGFEPCAADHEVERFARFSAREVLDLIAAHKVMHEAASSLLFSMAATPSAAD